MTATEAAVRAPNVLVATLVPTASVNIKPVATTSAAVTAAELVGVKQVHQYPLQQ